MRFVQFLDPTSDVKIEYINFSWAFEKASDAEKKDLKVLLKKMHTDLYLTTFTIPQEIEDVSVWLKLLDDGQLKGQHIYMVFGRNLETQNPDILGFTIADIGGDTNCGLIEYVVRQKGFGSILKGKDMLDITEKELNKLNVRLNGVPLKGIFWEANDPLKTENTQDCMSPQRRIDIITKEYGAKELGFDYVQGPLEECLTSEDVSNKICTNLKLYLYNASAYPYLTAQDVKNYICHFNKIVNKSNHPRDLKNPQINKMMDELDLMIEYNIPIISEEQSVAQKKLIQNVYLRTQFYKKVQDIYQKNHQI